MRKTNLQRLLARRPDGIFVPPFKQGEIGPDLFRKACEFGLEGLVSKRRDRPYRGGPSTCRQLAGDVALRRASISVVASGGRGQCSNRVCSRIMVIAA
jgi:hypothetical protein